MRKLIRELRIAAIIALMAVCAGTSQVNTWIKLTGKETGSRTQAALVYHPDSNRFLLTLGAIRTADNDFPYDVQMFSPSLGKWINFLPAAELYGIWADSTGVSFGDGTTGWGGSPFGFKNIPYGGRNYLRPNIYNANARVFRQFAYDPDSGKIYYYIQNIFFTYDLKTRLWDTIPVAGGPAMAHGGKTALWWGGLCYDPVNREIVLFGGGQVDEDRGNLGTWIFSLSDKTWRKLSPVAEPSPRCLSSMVYDPMNRCIVLFGGDHFDYLMSDTWVYHCATRTWEKKNPALAPAPRAGHALVFLPKSGKIVLLGGYDYLPEPTGGSAYTYRPMLELWTYDVAADAWHGIKAWNRSTPDIPKLRAKEDALVAADTGDNLLVLAEDTVSLSNPTLRTFSLQCDPSARDLSMETAYGVAPGTMTTHTGGWTPSWFTAGVAAPDTSATEAVLSNLPPNQWTEIRPPKWHTYHGFDWGATRYDPVHDVILSWNGGHSTYSGNQVLQYSLHTNRFSVGYHAEVPLSGEMNNSGPNGWPNYHSFSNRPFMTVHTYASYNVCEALERMVVVKGRHTYFYDPVRQDWDSVYLTHTELAASSRVNVIKAGRTLAAWVGKQVYLLDTLTRTWQLKVNDNSLGSFYADEDGACYDPVRNRIIMADGRSPSKTFILDMNTATLTGLSSAKDSVLNLLMGASTRSFREAVYLPNHDGIFFEPTSSGQSLFFDCAMDSWGLINIASHTFFINGSRSNGLMYDTKRGLVWLYNPTMAKDRFFVLRPDSLQVASLEKAPRAIHTMALSSSPNPFNPSVTITLTGSPAEGASLKVYDLSGHLITDLSDRVKDGRAIWNATGRASGVYMVTFKSNRLEMSKKIIYSR